MVTLHVKTATNFWQSAVGLIGAKKPYPLLLHTRFGIHSFGVRFPLDIIILNDQYEVMYLKKNLLPNRVFFWPPKWQWVLEVPEGTIQKEKIALGTRINVVL